MGLMYQKKGLMSSIPWAIMLAIWTKQITEQNPLFSF